MITASVKADSWVCFTGAGREMLRFAACIHHNVRNECVRKSRNEICIAQSAVSAVLKCTAEFCIDMSAFAETVEKFRLHEKARKEAMAIIVDNDHSKIPPKWGFLKNYQKVAARALAQPNLLGACIFDEQGTGKTLTALVAFDILQKGKEIDFMMVIAPQTALNSWANDVNEFCAGRTISVVNGNRSQKENMLCARVDIAALSYDSLVAMLPTAQAVARRGKCLLVVDEAFLVKNPEARRSRFIQELRAVCARAFVLSGTPAPRSPEDVIHQSDVADSGYAFHGYRATGDRMQDAESINAVLSARSVFLRRTKDEVLPFLPQKQFEIVKVALSNRQREMYLSARDDLVLHLKNINNETFKKELPSYFGRRAKLLQLCGCPRMVDKMFPDVHAKIERLDVLVDKIVVGDGKKLVIWTGYTESVEELQKRYSWHGLVSICGATPAEERKNAIDRFQNDPQVKIFLGNPAAAGAGITLHAASDSVYVSYTDRAAEFIQSIDRTHRIGQTAESVRYHFLVCENTIEVNQVRLLHQKMLSQSIMFGEDTKWPESVEEALAELSDE